MTLNDQRQAQQPPMYRVWLGEHAIDLTLTPETCHLAKAFAQLGPVDQNTPGLTLSIRADSAFVDRALRETTDAVKHQRRDGEHAWLVHHPRHIQTLLHASESPRDAMQAELFVESGQGLDGSIRARPGVDAISAWAATKGMFPIHASCAALNGEAFVFLGEGGRGKTTTAISLAQRGWDLIADDRCFLSNSGQEIKVSSLYATAILTTRSKDRLQAHGWENLGKSHKDKHALRLPSSIRVVPQARLAGVVWLTQSMGPFFQPLALGRREALLPWLDALAPTLQSHGPSTGWLKGLLSMSGAIAAWQLRIDWDFDQLNKTMRDLLLSVASGKPPT